MSLFLSAFTVPAVAVATPKNNLDYNKVLDENGNWVTQGGYYNLDWSAYNCYAFSIGRVEPEQFCESGNSFRYSPGNICGNGDYNGVNSIQALAELVTDDLIDLGYANVGIFNGIPSVNESEELICLRCNADYAETIDYHFMQYDYDTNAWYHKPGKIY